MDETLVNIGDSLLVSIGKSLFFLSKVTTDILILMRSFVHTGTPLSTVAETLVQNIGYRNSSLFCLSKSKKENICRMITYGTIVLRFHFNKSIKSKCLAYLAIECLDQNEEESQLCDLCGVVPEVVLGELSNSIKSNYYM